MRFLRESAPIRKRSGRKVYILKDHRFLEVKALQSSVKASFRQLPKAWQAVKGSKEAQGKVSAQRRKALARLATASVAKSEAENQVAARRP